MDKNTPIDLDAIEPLVDWLVGDPPAIEDKDWKKGIAKPGMDGVFDLLIDRLGERSDVLGLVVRQGMGLAATGLVLGLIGSLLAGQLLEGLLFSVSPRDPLVLVGSLTLLAAVAFVACLVPAMKAAGIHSNQKDEKKRTRR